MVLPDDDEWPATIEELREVMAQMAREGDLVAIPEVDPATGGWRISYCLPEQAPTIN